MIILIGAILGYSAILRHYLDNLEIEPVLFSAADIKVREVNLCVGDRYVKHLPAEVDERYLL